MEHDEGLSESLLAPRFESVRLLGRGGMGAVYLASDRLLSRLVAIKILAPELAADAVSRERFAREATLAGRLGAHPHIVTAFEAGEWERRPYVVFEYMPHGSLAERLRDGGRPPRAQALRWLAQAAEALDYAHAAKVVHRDIKPANLLLDADDDLSIADFGVSRSADETTLTAHGEVLGTAGYLAPEQAAGPGATAASDRFALGVVAYQLLSGRLRTADGDRLAAPVEALFDRALAQEPDRRFPTATAFVDALGATLESQPEPTAVEPTRRKLLPPRTTPGVRRGAARSPRARHRQRSGLWRAAAFLLVALAIAAPAAAGGMVLGQDSIEVTRRRRRSLPDRVPVRGLAVRRRREPRRPRCRRGPFLSHAGHGPLGAGPSVGVPGQHAPGRAGQRQPERPQSHLRARPGRAHRCGLRRPRAEDRDQPLSRVRRGRLGASQFELSRGSLLPSAAPCRSTSTAVRTDIVSSASSP